MHPLVRAAAVAALLTAVGSFDREDAPDPSGADQRPALPALCGPRAVPDGSACVPVPLPSTRAAGAPTAPADQERIPRRPDRAEDYRAYRYPVDATGFVPTAAGAALELATGRGAPVTALALENQQGDAEVAFVGEVYGTTTVVTKHAVRDGNRDRAYLVVLCNLTRLSPSVTVGAHLASGAPIGSVADPPNGTPTQLHLEIRRVQPGASVDKLDAARVTSAAVSAAIDPRNVLPTR